MSNTINVKEPIQELISIHREWVNNQLKNIQNITKIESQEEFNLATKNLDYGKRSLKVIETKRLEITKPLRDYVDRINKDIKNRLENPLSEIVSHLSSITIAFKKEQFDKEQERLRIEKEKIAELERQTLLKLQEQNQLNDKVKESVAKTAEKAMEIIEMEKPVEAYHQVSTDMGKQSFLKRKVFDVENSSIVDFCAEVVANPDLAKYLTWNNVLINKEIKPNCDTIEYKGIKFKEEIYTRTGN